MSPQIIGWIASAVFLGRLLPQPIRLARTGVPHGVSPLSAMNAAIADFGWVVYGLSVGLVPVWGVAVLALVPSVWNTSLLRRQVTRRDLLGAGLWLGIILVMWRADRLGVVLGGTVLVCQGPQVWAALRSNDLRGLAPATWWIAIVDAALWGAYGVVERDGALMAYGTVLLTSAVIVLVRLRFTRLSAAPEFSSGPTAPSSGPTAPSSGSAAATTPPAVLVAAAADVPIEIDLRVGTYTHGP